jgi:hypothetical protein
MRKLEKEEKREISTLEIEWINRLRVDRDLI